MTVTCTWVQAKDVCNGKYSEIIYSIGSGKVQKFGTGRGNIFVLNPGVEPSEFLAEWPEAKEVSNIS